MSYICRPSSLNDMQALHPLEAIFVQERTRFRISYLWKQYFHIFWKKYFWPILLKKITIYVRFFCLYLQLTVTQNMRNALKRMKNQFSDSQLRYGRFFTEIPKKIMVCISLLGQGLNIWSQKMRNVLKRMQKQFSNFFA